MVTLQSTDLIEWPIDLQHLMGIYWHINTCDTFFRTSIYRTSTPCIIMIGVFYIGRTRVLVEGIHYLISQKRALYHHKGTCSSAPLLYLDEDCATTATPWLSWCFYMKVCFLSTNKTKKIHNTLSVVDRQLRLMGNYKNPLHLDVINRYLRRMGDKTIPDEAPPSLESFYPPWGMPYLDRNVLCILCLVHQQTLIKVYFKVKAPEHRRFVGCRTVVIHITHIRKWRLNSCVVMVPSWRLPACVIHVTTVRTRSSKTVA